MRGRDFISEERKIGRKYAIALRDSFKSQVSVLDKKSGLTSKPGYRVRFRDLELKSISVRTVKSAFINHYGVDTTRKSHFFKSKLGNTFERKAHPFKLTPKIKDLNIPAQIINGFADELTNLRGDEILAEAGKNFQIK